MDKNIKKWIVNILTSLRIVGTLILPVLCTCVSSTAFLLIVGAILFTDFLDGKLARRWEVSTLCGSLLDMGADKLFGISILIVLAFTYPIMAIPAGLEILIASINTKSVLKGNKAKSKWTGKIKMGVSFFSILALLMIGASPEIKELLSEIDIETFKNILVNNNIDNSLINKIAVAFDKTLKFIKESGIKMTDFFVNNKVAIENTVIPATIAAETVTLADYAKDYSKIKDNESKKLLEELKKYKEYLKDYKFKKYLKEVMFDEEYHENTVDEPLIKKLMPNKNKVVDK